MSNEKMRAMQANSTERRFDVELTYQTKFGYQDSCFVSVDGPEGASRETIAQMAKGLVSYHTRLANATVVNITMLPRPEPAKANTRATPAGFRPDRWWVFVRRWQRWKPAG
jgi:hypothetical protein